MNIARLAMALIATLCTAQYHAARERRVKQFLKEAGLALMPNYTISGTSL